MFVSGQMIAAVMLAVPLSLAQIQSTNAIDQLSVAAADLQYKTSSGIKT